jgi:DNA-binding XRE family transcriptional regulator
VRPLPLYKSRRASSPPSLGRTVIEFLGYDPNPPPCTLGDRLKAARRAAGLSQRELARRLGCHHSTIYWYERDGSPPSEHGELPTRLVAFLERPEALLA